MSELITRREFAKRTKKSEQYIGKLCKEGKLILHNKKLDYKESINILKSLSASDNNLRDKFNKEQRGKGAKKAAADRNAGKSESEKIDPEINLTSKAMLKARLLKEMNAAKLAEIEYKKAVGKLIDRDELELESAKIAEVVRAKLLSLPNRAAPKLVGLKKIVVIQEILLANVNEILEEFQELAKQAQKKTG